MPAKKQPSKKHPAKSSRPRLDAVPDRVDVRDWFYRPTLAPLADQVVHCDRVPVILDQGQEGACTGFALAAVANFHLHKRGVGRRVSPRMLYEMARRYDEWPGEGYEGSSARGAIKGWVAHGVCTRDSWPDAMHGPWNLSDTFAGEALKTPGGAYYRVMHRQVRDMHAALHEAGILYCTLMVHDGWFEPSKPYQVAYVSGGRKKRRNIPLIERKGRADGGHAIALVGYTKDGFIVQNSWGETWGGGGFALLPYEDYLLHATDVWVAQLGVPVEMNVWVNQKARDHATVGIQRADAEISLSEIRPYVIDIGNNGKLSTTGQYWTFEQDVERLVKTTIPDATRGWAKRRVLLYLHGGLNDEKAVARRIIAFRDVLLANEIYPVHIMWETGPGETILDIVGDLFTKDDERAGGWFDKLRDGLTEAKDRTFELTVAAPGKTLWDEMKENARQASLHPEGGMKILARFVHEALQGAAPDKWELHVVGHSAGSIFAAQAMNHLLDLGVPLQSMNFLAPAISVRDFKSLVLPHIEAKRIARPGMFILGDQAERDDTVAIYGKSLLYLVSNAFENRRSEPLLGMEKFVSKDGPAGAASADKALAELFAGTRNGLPGLVIAGRKGPDHSVSGSKTHGGFDDDEQTMNALLCRILGVKQRGELKRQFTKRDLEF